MNTLPSPWRAAAAVLVIVLAGGCSEAVAGPDETPAEDVVLRVVLGDAVVADWTLDELSDSVAFVEMTIDGDLQSGPLLLDVLEASGVEVWSGAQVVGFGEGRVFEVGLDIDAADVDDGWILDVNNRGKLKLASASLPRSQWVRDVGEINVAP